MKTKFILPFIVFLALLILFYYGLKNDPNQLNSPLIGQPVPHFKLPDLESPKPLISEHVFLGHISLLHVWASWCASCKEEHAFLKETFKKSDGNFKVYGLNYKDQRENALLWLNQLGNPYHKVIRDEFGDLSIDLGIQGTPETFLIDTQGVIRYKHVGPLTDAVWQNEFLPKIKEIRESS
jgi:cytochrome c biogenesis protein CcmG, thiol:disulfide interchange protein DsbE